MGAIDWVEPTADRLSNVTKMKMRCISVDFTYSDLHRHRISLMLLCSSNISIYK